MPAATDRFVVVALSDHGQWMVTVNRPKGVYPLIGSYADEARAIALAQALNSIVALAPSD